MGPPLVALAALLALSPVGDQKECPRCHRRYPAAFRFCPREATAVALMPLAAKPAILPARVNVNGQDNAGDTALIRACRNGHRSVVVELLRHGADASIRNRAGRTALIEASDQGRADIVRTLLAHDHR